MDKKNFLKKDKGIIGLNILLSVVIMLFLIGFIIFIFALMAAEMEPQVYDFTKTTIANGTTNTVVNDTGTVLAATTSGVLARDCTLTVVDIYNATSIDLIHVDNYTVVDCTITYTGKGDYNNTLWNITGSYTWNQNSTASYVIFDVSDELSGTTDWYGIIIVITAMIVLILLTVIIITTIRGTGLIAGEGGGIAGGGGRAPKTTA